MPSNPSRKCLLLLALCLGLTAALPATALAQFSPRNELNRLRQQIQRELRARPEYLQAKQEYIELRREYEALRRAVVEELSRDSTYLSIRSRMWDYEDELSALHRRYRFGIAPDDEKMRLAKLILEHRNELSRIENEALQRHKAALEAREAYRDAARRIFELNREMRDLIRTDPRFQQALQNLNRQGGAIGGRRRP